MSRFDEADDEMKFNSRLMNSIDFQKYVQVDINLIYKLIMLIDILY